MEGCVAEDNHAFFALPNQPLKGVIRDIGGGTPPPHHQPPLIQHETQFPTHKPPVIREALPAAPLRTPAPPDGLGQLRPIPLADPQDRRICQEALPSTL